MNARRLTLGVVGLAVFLLIDVSVGTLRRVVVDRAGERALQSVVSLEREFRIEHPYYHHDLVPRY